jgi:hypothetical protein
MARLLGYEDLKRSVDLALYAPGPHPCGFYATIPYWGAHLPSRPLQRKALLYTVLYLV